jgi:hypothetical protein
MRLMSLFSTPKTPPPPVPTGSVIYSPDGRMEISGYTMTDVLRLLDHMRNAGSDAMTARFGGGEQ